MSDFNPNSVDAMFATVLTKLESIEESTKKSLVVADDNSRRLSALERAQLRGTARIAGAVAAISFVIGSLGFAVQKGLINFFK